MKRLFRLLIPLFAMTTPLQAQLIVAHRGASHDAPENTVAAFNLAWEQNADAVEGDFYLTRDGKIACIHDKTTKKTAGKEIKVADATLAELQKLEYGAWKHAKYKGEPLPTLDDALKTVPAGKKIFIEIKCGPEIVPALKAALKKSSLKPEQTIVIAFDEEVIAAVKQTIPGIKAFWLTSFKLDAQTGKWTPSVGSILGTLKKIKADGLDCKAEPKVVTKAFVKKIRAAGMELHCWTINDAKLARKFQKLGFDSITTDRPAFLRKALAKTP